MKFYNRYLILKKIFCNKSLFLPTDTTLIYMGGWRDNKHYFKLGLNKKMYTWTINIFNTVIEENI